MPTPNTCAWLNFCLFDESVYRGGCLVTDIDAEPLEFRCTDAVRPSGLQKVLWGKRLRAHLFCHVVGEPLIAALDTRPDVVLVCSEQLLGLRDVARVPVVLVAQKPAGGSHRALPGEPVLYLSAAGGHSDDIDRALPFVERVSRLVGLSEPFARVQTAVQQIHKDETTGKAV